MKDVTLYVGIPTQINLYFMSYILFAMNFQSS
jgi:hypothetical protein